jgi:hypothetical protein
MAVPGVGQRGRRRLVDDVDHVQAGDPPGVGGGLAAGVVEIVGDRDHGVADLADAFLGVLPQLLEDQGGDELGREGAALVLLLKTALAHVTLDPLDHPLGIFHRRPRAVRTDDHPAAVAQQDEAGRFHLVVVVGDGDRIALLVELGNGREGRAQVDADRMAFHETDVHGCCWLRDSTRKLP